MSECTHAGEDEDDLYAFATVDKLAAYLGEPIEDVVDRDRAAWALASASGLVMDHTGRDKDSWERSGIPGRVVQVVLACAARAWTNPEGWQYESIDDWRAGGRRVDEAGLYLTASERRALSPYAAAPMTRGFGIVSTTREVWPDSHGLDPLAAELIYGRRE